MAVFPFDTLADLVAEGAKKTRQITGSMYQPPITMDWDEETQTWVTLANPDPTPGACAMGDAYIAAGVDMTRDYDIDNDWDSLLADKLGITRDHLLAYADHYRLVPVHLWKLHPNGWGDHEGTYLDAVFWMNDRDELPISEIVANLRAIHKYMLALDAQA